MFHLASMEPSGIAPGPLQSGVFLRPADGAEVEKEMLAVYDEHASGMMRFIHGATGDREFARESIQDAFLALLEVRRRGYAVSNCREWLYKAIGEALRARYESKTWSEEPVEAPEPVEMPADIAEEADLQRHLERVASPRERQILLLRREGLSYSEIARTLKLSTGTVGSMLTRLARKLQREVR